MSLKPVVARDIDLRHLTEANLWAVLDLLPSAVILARPDGRVLGMNVRAQAILRDGDAVRFDGARVRAAMSPIADERLQASISAGKSSAFLLKRLSNRRPMEMAIVPLAVDCCAMLISDPEHACVANLDRLRSLYGLTPAEARVLAGVVRGEGSDAAARTLGMSVHTLRRHLKSIFAKLNVERQSELVKVVMLGVATLCD